MVALASSAGY